MDAVGLVVIALGAAIVLAAAIWWVTQGRDGPTPPQPSGEDSLALSPRADEPAAESPDVPTFRVVALGMNGAGKTVLLASQARKLLPAAGRRYHLASGLEQDRLLAKLHREVRDTSAPWPRATRMGDTREFLFSCKASDRVHQQCTVFRISYLDYPGEILEPSDVTLAAAELEARVDDAHALLLVLDGRRVLQLLRGEREGHEYFEDRLWPLLGLAHRATCPVQLIVSKWDLVRSFASTTDDDELLRQDDELLRQVSKRLLDHIPAMKWLVHTHCQRGEEVRLIPVSAVGSRFAELCADGTVVKRADGRLDPINVDVPMCAVIPDLLKRVERSLEPSVQRELDEAIDRAPAGDVVSIAVSVLESRVGMLLRNALATMVGDVVVTLFVETLVRSRAHRVEPPPSDDAEAERRRLRVDVVKDMEKVVEDFEYRLPSSILCTRRLQ